MGLPDVPAGYTYSPRPSVSLVYLKAAILNQKLPADIIPTVDVYSCCNPHHIPFSKFKHGAQDEWHFFTTRRKEYPIQTANGCWEEIEDEEIFDGNRSVGFMKELAFKYLRSEDLEKDKDKEWYIHEFRVNPTSFTADELADDNVKEKISNSVLCKVFCEEVVPSKPPSLSSSDDTVDDEQDEELERGQVHDPNST